VHLEILNNCRPNRLTKIKSEDEIAGCISDIGIPFTVADLHQPKPQQVQRVFEWFGELLMNLTRDVVAPAMRAAVEETAGMYGELFSSDTTDLMGFFIMLRRLLHECGVDDFTFQDLYKPERGRLVKTLSHIINFIRFRESQTATIDTHFNKAEQTKHRIDALYLENQTAEERLAHLERNRRAVDNAIKEKEARHRELKDTLRKLLSAQGALSEKLARFKDEQSRLKAMLEDKTTATLDARADANKLRPYTTQSPSALEANLAALTTTLSDTRTQTDALDRRARALQTSADAFTSVTADTASCTALLSELARDLNAEETALSAAARNADALSLRTSAVRDVERSERALAKKLENTVQRTERLRAEEAARKARASARLEELRGVMRGIQEERRGTQEEIERRRARVEGTERKMVEMREQIEAELASVREEWGGLESVVGSYVKEMEAVVCI